MPSHGEAAASIPRDERTLSARALTYPFEKAHQQPAPTTNQTNQERLRLRGWGT
jgi:hypothetical protein